MRRTVPLFDAEPARRGGFVLRRATPEELDELIEIEHRAFERPWSPALLRKELSHDWSTILLAAEETASGERLVGLLVFWWVHDEIHVLNVATDPVARRRGVARALLEETLERGRKAGAALATLEVRRSNTAAIALYEALGFRRVGVRPRYYAEENEDAIVMTLPLEEARAP